MFKKLIAGIVLALSFSTAFATTTTSIDVSGLSDAQIAELKAHAAQAVADVAKTGSLPSKPAEVGAMVTLAATWGQQAAAAAEGFAKALSIAARELGVTVNDFMHTDAGRLTAALIIWKVAGASIMHALWAGLFVFVSMVIARMIYVRLFTKEFIRVPYSRFFGAFTGERLVRVTKTFSDLNDEGEWMGFWLIIIISIGSLLVGAVII